MRRYVFMSLLLTALLVPRYLHAAHGISMDGKLKYPADFARFDYVATEAKKGGSLTLHALGSFDKMNPFTLKGNAPYGLNSLVFETLDGCEPGRTLCRIWPDRQRYRTGRGPDVGDLYPGRTRPLFRRQPRHRWRMCSFPWRP